MYMKSILTVLIIFLSTYRAFLKQFQMLLNNLILRLGYPILFLFFVCLSLPMTESEVTKFALSVLGNKINPLVLPSSGQNIYQGCLLFLLFQNHWLISFIALGHIGLDILVSKLHHYGAKVKVVLFWLISCLSNRYQLYIF